MTVDFQPSTSMVMPHNLGESMEPTVEELESELPVVYDGQIPLGELLSRVVQSIYAELSELAETYVVLD